MLELLAYAEEKTLKSAFARLEYENATFNKSFFKVCKKGKLIWDMLFCF